MEWSNLAKVVYKRTYARPIGDRTENWAETVERVIQGNIRGHNVSKKEIERLRYYLLNRKATPAGRGLWYSGTESHYRLGGVALNNCWQITSEEWENFVLAQDLLMLGGGTGMSVEHRFTSKLPRVKKNVKVVHKATNDAEFIIPDSREGWCELTRRFLESHFVTGKSFSFSTVCLRGYGELISGFGGKASGPLPLIEFIEKLQELFEKRQGKHLRPIDCADVLCCIGELVVSGNVRRSALLILGDPWDKEYLTAKRWDLGSIPTQRSRGNFSVVCDDVDDLHPLFWKTYEAGEPFGIVNRKNIQKYGRMGELKKDTGIGVNPCQPAWATVLTPEGIRTFKDISVGNTIWSGHQWTKVISKLNTGIKSVFAYKTNAGIFNGTENHRVVSDGTKIEVKDAGTIDTCVGGAENGPLQIQDVMDGLVIGDGTVHKASNNLVLLIIGKDDQDYFTSEIKDLIIKHRPGINAASYEIDTSIEYKELYKTYDRIIPDRFRFGNSTQVRGFLRGLFTANGSIAGKRVCLKASSAKLVLQVQEMLSSLGIRSYITTNKSKDVQFANGIYTCKQSYDINISSDRNRFQTLIGFIQKYKQNKLNQLCENHETGNFKKTYEIVEREYLGDEEVFDITVDCAEHTYWTGGLLVSNCGEACLEDGEPCNLQEIALPNLNSIEEFEEAARLMHRWGKRVTCEVYHHEKCQEVVKRNRRIGTGITGCLQSSLFVPETLDKVYAAIQDENVNYSKELNINPSIRTTVIKPSGTMSKVMDVQGEGIHGGFSKYWIQRIRFSANDQLIPLLKACGHFMEPESKFDGTSDHKTLVVDFYCEAKNNLPLTDEGWDTWQQLDVVKMAQKHWADQSISVTVYYKRDDISRLKEWLANNLQYLKTISFLCHSEHGFKQAPKEAISQEKYEQLSEKVKTLDIEQVAGGEMTDSLECEGGACPVK